MSEIEVDRGIKLPEHPHLRDLRRSRKEVLRSIIVQEGRRVGGLRSENEVLGRILEDTKLRPEEMEDGEERRREDKEEEEYG